MTSRPPGPDSARDTRREPPLGRFDELQFRTPASSKDESATGAWQRVRAWDWRWIGALAAFLLVLLLVLREPLANWLWPQTRAERLRNQAALALRSGRLTAPDGSGARELYQAALALDPDRSDARAGLNRVGQAALAQAREAIARQQYARAHSALRLADDLLVPRAQVEALRRQVREHEAAAVGIDDLLARAAAARAAGRLDGDEGALPLYQRVLELQPNRTAALEGREDTLADLLQQARAHLSQGDLAAASVLVRRVQGADAGHVELPGTLAALARAAEARRTRADRDLRRARLDAALEGYGAALLVDPADAAALRGVHAVAAAHARRSERLAADYRFGEAEAALRRAQEIVGGKPGEVPAIAQARQHLERARQVRRQAGTPLSSTQRQRRVSELLADAARAQARGDLLTPPGESAFDKLRSARALAPDDARVRAASSRLAPAALSCFREALADNRLVRAGACLDARRALEGESATVRAGRRELAGRWVDMGDQRLGAGDLRGARSALESARALDPGAEGLAGLADRLRAASVSP